MSLFSFLDDVIKPAQRVAQGTERAIEADVTRLVDQAAKRLAKRVESRVENRVAGFLSPTETDDEYYARTGTLRQNDWG